MMPAGHASPGAASADPEAAGSVGPGVERPASRRPSGATDRPARRRRLAALLGDVLPETTRDDRPAPVPGADADRWYLDNRPPHHGG
jgi:hypothetical protein